MQVRRPGWSLCHWCFSAGCCLSTGSVTICRLILLAGLTSRAEWVLIQHLLIDNVCPRQTVCAEVPHVHAIGQLIRIQCGSASLSFRHYIESLVGSCSFCCGYHVQICICTHCQLRLALQAFVIQVKQDYSICEWSKIRRFTVNNLFRLSRTDKLSAHVHTLKRQHRPVRTHDRLPFSAFAQRGCAFSEDLQRHQASLVDKHTIVR